MRKVICITVISLISVFILVGCSQKVQQGNILAEFSDQIVTMDEFDKEFSELSEREQRKYEGQEGREEYLTLMAESRMLLEVATDKRLDRDEEIVTQVRDYKDKLMVEELVKREVDEQVKVTDEDLKQYYEEHKAEYVEPDKVSVTEITLKDEEKAKEVMEKIKGGADFTELAKEIDAKGESFGPGQGNEGKTRPFSRDRFSSAQNFVETAFSLEAGAMSDIIVQPLGEETYYMIIRTDEHIPSRQKEFSEVESSIRRAVQKQKKKERMDEWLEEVKDSKKFKLYLDRIPKPVEAVEEEKAEEAAAEEETEQAEKVEKEETAGEQETSEESVEENQ